MAGSPYVDWLLFFRPQFTLRLEALIELVSKAINRSTDLLTDRGIEQSTPVPCNSQAKEAGCSCQTAGGAGETREGGESEACARGKIGVAAAELFLLIWKDISG